MKQIHKYSLDEVLTGSVSTPVENIPEKVTNKVHERILSFLEKKDNILTMKLWDENH
jgi:hypothetical protein